MQYHRDKQGCRCNRGLCFHRIRLERALNQGPTLDPADALMRNHIIVRRASDAKVLSPQGAQAEVQAGRAVMLELDKHRIEELYDRCDRAGECILKPFRRYYLHVRRKRRGFTPNHCLGRKCPYFFGKMRQVNADVDLPQLSVTGDRWIACGREAICSLAAPDDPTATDPRQDCE